LGWGFGYGSKRWLEVGGARLEAGGGLRLEGKREIEAKVEGGEAPEF
jgi:hypothetical protein